MAKEYVQYRLPFNPAPADDLPAEKAAVISNSDNTISTSPPYPNEKDYTRKLAESEP